MTRSKSKLNVTEGPIFFGMLRFAIPIVLNGILQVTYSMADSIIVGKFSGDFDALGAVGSTTSLVNLVTNVMISISVGVGVTVAQTYGARDEKEVSSAVHTSMGVSIIGGLVMMLIGFISCRPALVAMGTQEAYLEKAVLYVYVVSLGIPAVAIFNFCSGILRAIGDSKTSLYILTASGLANVGLNLIFVAVFNMSVEGVAIATVASQYMSAVSAVTVLMRRRGECYRFVPKKIKIEKKYVGKIMRIGVPSAIQSALVSVSIIFVTSGVNSFAQTVVDAKAIAFSIEALTYTAMNSIAGATMTYMGQNFGAKKYTRMNKIFSYAMVQVVAIGVIISQTEIFFGRELAMLYIDSANPNTALIVDAVMEIFSVMLAFYFLGGILEISSAVLKSLGYSMRSMIAGIIGIVARVLWILLLVPKFHTVKMLFLSYIVGWVVSIIVSVAFCIEAWHKLGVAKLAKEEIKR